MWLPQIVKGYTLLLSVVPSVFGDFTAHQFRLTGKSLLIVDCSPDRLQFVGGVLYLNRENIRLLARRRLHLDAGRLDAAWS